jgi:hypothetical protein
MMTKKGIRVPRVAPDHIDEGIQLSPPDLLELTKREHAAQLAHMGVKLAEAHNRAVRMEIEQAARAASEGQRRTQTEYDAALKMQRDFAEDLAKRYAFTWQTHSYNADTGVVRRLTED